MGLSIDINLRLLYAQKFDPSIFFGYENNGIEKEALGRGVTNTFNLTGQEPSEWPLQSYHSDPSKRLKKMK